MQSRPLGKTGIDVSVLGFGASPLGNEFGSTDEDECIRAVHRAIDLGINCFDTSPYYGRGLSETRLGKALMGKRQQVVVTTKCGRYDVDSFDFSAARVRRSIDESLKRLQSDYVDVLFAHDVEYGDPVQVIEETIPALRAVQQAGKARAIGITGFPVRLLLQIAQATKVDAIMSYCRYNLLMDDLAGELAPFCMREGIGLFNASPLHMRVLSGKGAPDWHPAPAEVKAVARAVIASCQQRGVSVEDVALQYCLQWEGAASTVVGMSKTAHVESNVLAMNGTPTAELLAEIEALVKPVKNRAWSCGLPGNEQFVYRVRVGRRGSHAH
jgi:L-galactose dehydrogenase